MKKVFLECLPRIGKGNNKGKINWKESIGYKIKFIYDDIQGEITIIRYESKGQRLYIKYLNENIINMTSTNFQNCQLGRMLGKYTGNFKIKIGQVFKDNKRDIIIIDRKYKVDKEGTNRKWYKYKCNKCGYDGWIIENSLLGGSGCPVCCPSPRIVVQGINDIPTTNPEMIKYFQGGYDEAKLYTKTSNKKIYPICPDCGRVKNKCIGIDVIYKQGISCSCSDGQSYPNKFCFNILEQLGVNFETEYSPKWCKYEYENKLRQGRYDFYFELNNNNKYIIEMDGKWHNNDNNMSGQTKEESKFIDDEKDRLAGEYGIKVIRIDSEKSELEYMKNKILNSELNDILDLSKINWNLAEEFALSNLVKKACELKRDNPDMTTTEISKLIKISRTSAKKYLKQGAKLGWCDYDPKEELIKSIIKNKKASEKSLEIFKNGKSLGCFFSVSELERQSEKLFGVKLNNPNISIVCHGKRKLYKGFTFKYIDKLEEIV